MTKQTASDAALEYIRNYYRVPAFKGAKVRYRGDMGVIKGGTGAYLLIRIDGETTNYKCHPTWEMEYLKDEVKH